MLFNSYIFILFLVVVLVLHNLALPWKVKKINLLLASYLFYAVWNPPFVLLIWLSTIVDFEVGKRIYDEDNPLKKKALLGLSLIVNLGLLGFFKYGGFLLENFTVLVNGLGFAYAPAEPDIILPVGISFYTFQTLSYTLDMYKRRSAPEDSLLDFSLFVTFFPQLVAGPIVRPGQLIPQFKEPRTATSFQLMWGLYLLSLGLFMKVVLADSMLAGPADSVFGAATPLLALDAWLGVLAFSGQIFFDFAGYSTCAIGIASCLGFSLPHNFLYPYAAIGFSDFWRRWHITLSTWLRDYLYIPLGGNRVGEVRTYINLMITMLLGGLWHGASWTFVVWGALHGVYLCVEKAFKDKLANMPGTLSTPPVPGQVMAQASFMPGILNGHIFSRFLLAMLTFFFINVTWVFFRAPDFATAWQLLYSMFGFASDGTPLLTGLEVVKVSVIISLLVATHWIMRTTSLLETAKKLPWWLFSIAWTGMLILLMLSQESSSSFIYFQF